MRDTPDPTATFERHRARLFGIAYRMLGTVQDAEDLVQETWLRWQGADPVVIRSPEAWLVAVISRLAIDRLRHEGVEREAYPGMWLPEPIATDRHSAPDHQAEVASDLSMAFLVLLERLAPEERAAFLLREVFDCGYAEIAQVLGKSPEASRQVVHRARERARRDRPPLRGSLESRERLLERFLAALQADDRDRLLAVFAEDATWVADGGGKVPATRKVVRGAGHIVRFLLAVERKTRGFWTHRVGWLNGEPALITSTGGRVVCTTSVDTDGERVVAAYRVLNPDKLRHVGGKSEEQGARSEG
jgi:RNA polymerase sigma-70 factor (ECF subfamily)